MAMDSIIAAAARALAGGDALGALKLIALRDDAPALALRGIAMAQLGEYPLARELLGAPRAASARARRSRVPVASSRKPRWRWPCAISARSPRALATAAAALEARADRANALQARLIAVRRLLLLGRLDEAAAALARARRERPAARPCWPWPSSLPRSWPCARCARHRRERRSTRARQAAERARVPALLAEVAEARAALDRPAARRVDAGHERPLRLEDVEALHASGALVVDACRRDLEHRRDVAAARAPAGAVRAGASARRGVAAATSTGAC